jgi:hypothetical protein
MSAILFAALFAFSGLLALTAIRQSLRHYGPVALALRGEFRECRDWREVRVTVHEIKVHPRGGAVVLRPDFKGRERCPAPVHGLPAAA